MFGKPYPQPSGRIASRPFCRGFFSVFLVYEIYVLAAVHAVFIYVIYVGRVFSLGRHAGYLGKIFDKLIYDKLVPNAAFFYSEMPVKPAVKRLVARRCHVIDELYPVEAGQNAVIGRLGREIPAYGFGGLVPVPEKPLYVVAYGKRKAFALDAAYAYNVAEFVFDELCRNVDGKLFMGHASQLGLEFRNADARYERTDACLERAKRHFQRRRIKRAVIPDYLRPAVRMLRIMGTCFISRSIARIIYRITLPCRNRLAELAVIFGDLGLYPSVLELVNGDAVENFRKLVETALILQYEIPEERMYLV